MSPARSAIAALRRASLDARLRLLQALRLGPEALASDQEAAGAQLVVSGFFSEHSGVAQAGRLTLAAMQRAGLSPLAHDIQLGESAVRRGRSSLPGNDGGVWFIHANAPETLSLLLAHPIEQWRRRRRIAYWVWETPEAPASWARVAPYLHEIWSPTTFSADAIRAGLRRAGRSDLVARIRVMPHPVRPEPLPQPPPPAATEMTALAMVDARSAISRKNPQGALDTWFAAFPRAETGRRLILKARNLDGPMREALVRRIGARADVQLLESELAPAEMAVFTRAADLVLSLHRSEGFGLVLAEAMARGACVLCTGWSGNMDFMDEHSAALVPYRLVEIRDPDGVYRGSRWAEPDIEAAARLLAALAADPDARARLARNGRDRIAALSRPWEAGSLETSLRGRPQPAAASATASAVMPNSL